ncbi:MAG: OmpH family outer membrane protein [Chlamydiales bacterium]|nr:OmpH family outer membrane protein [Chlamydiales bacterium]
MKKLSILTLAILALGCAKVQAEELKLGFVNFKECMDKSAQGRQEQGAFETMRNQMQETLEKTNTELEEIAEKLQDQDYMDGLSPAAEDELKGRFQQLSQEFGRYQNQYYQILNQANYQMMQSLHTQVSVAAEKVRQKRQLALIMNEDSVFASSDSLNVTNSVIEEMDRRFELENGAAHE